MSAKLAAWLSGKPYSPKPRICSKTRSANSSAMPFFDHARDQRSRCCSMRPERAPRGHVAAQLVGLAGGVVGGDHRQLHHLLLEQRHAQRLREHRLEARVRIDDLLEAARRRRYGCTMPPVIGPGPHDADTR
jgi:hypothetical protein